MLLIKAGTTSKIIRIFAPTSGGVLGLAGLLFNTLNLSASYSRIGDNAATPITLSAGTLGTWSSGGFKEVDAVRMPGIYELGLPNAALASGSEGVMVYLAGATGMGVGKEDVQLVGYDPAAAYPTTDLTGLTATANAIKAKTDTITAGGTLTIDERNAIANNLLDKVGGVEGTLTVRQALRLILAAVAGKVSIVDKTTYKFRDCDDTKDRITATCDNQGNRTAIDYDPS